MVIPGVSGSMVLMVLGYYSTILALVTGTVTMLKDMDIGGVINNCLLLAPFGVGVVLGIFLIAKVIEYLFQRFPQPDFRGHHRPDRLLSLCHPLFCRRSERLLGGGAGGWPGAGGPGRLGHLADGQQGRGLIHPLGKNEQAARRLLVFLCGGCPRQKNLSICEENLLPGSLYWAKGQTSKGRGRSAE